MCSMSMLRTRPGTRLCHVHVTVRYMCDTAGGNADDSIPAFTADKYTICMLNAILPHYDDTMDTPRSSRKSCRPPPFLLPSRCSRQKEDSFATLISTIPLGRRSFTMDVKMKVKRRRASHKGLHSPAFRALRWEVKSSWNAASRSGEEKALISVAQGARRRHQGSTAAIIFKNLYMFVHAFACVRVCIHMRTWLPLAHGQPLCQLRGSTPILVQCPSADNDRTCTCNKCTFHCI